MREKSKKPQFLFSNTYLSAINIFVLKFHCEAGKGGERKG
jgi:hypothetical protein